MKQDNVITLESSQKRVESLPETLPPARILVPVDSSGSAFNSLAYTLRLAKAWNAGIHLLYIIDIAEIPDSDNAYVIEGVMNRLESKATICLDSLRELIQEMGIKVIMAESGMGNVKSLLRKKIDTINPELIVTGRGGLNKKVLKSLVRQASCPVLIVPDAATPRIPSSVLWVTDDKELSDRNLESVMKITQRTSRELHVLPMGKSKNSGKQTLQVDQNGNFPVHYYDQEDAETISEVDKFVKAHRVDIVCSILLEQNFLRRTFSYCLPLELARKLSVPVLVIREP